MTNTNLCIVFCQRCLPLNIMYIGGVRAAAPKFFPSEGEKQNSTMSLRLTWRQPKPACFPSTPWP